MVSVIAARELRGLFGSPLAWAVLAVVQLILGYMFLTRIDLFVELQPRLAGLDDAPGLTDIVVAPLLGSAGIVLLLVVPLLTMHLIAEERRSGTLRLLLAAPVSMTEIALGKYLGLMAFLLIMLGLVALMPCALLMGASLDFGQFGAALLGLALVVAAFAAIGLFLSTMTDHPTVAAITGFGALLLLWIVDWSGEAEGAAGVLGYLSMVRHFESLLKGVFNSVDVLYYLIVIALFLALAIWRLDAERLQR